eukprot:Gb_23392 [translate_table: standard]
MDFSKERLLLIVSIFLVITKTLAFHSDELQDDEEWGLVGGRSAEAGFIRPPTISRNKVTQDNSASDSKVQFVLEHAFGDSDFSPAGVFSARLRASPHGGQTLTKLRLSRNTLTESEQKLFEELLKEDGFYKIRVPANVLSPGNDYVLSSIKARCLSGAELEERFIIHMEGVNVIAITYGSTSECSYPRLLKYPIRWSFNSHTVLKSSEQASRMLTMPEDILGGENEGENDEAKKPPERSFWAKYWMYVVPLGLIVMNAITQAMNMPEEQAGGQASTQAGPQRIANSGARRR